MVKCNNEHKIIKSSAKAIGQASYNSGFELDGKRVCAVLKVYAAVGALSQCWAGSGGGSGVAALALASRMVIFPEAFQEVRNSWSSRHCTKFFVIQLKLIF